jgi:hypothetical protein
MPLEHKKSACSQALFLFGLCVYRNKITSPLREIVLFSFVSMLM